MTAMPPLMSRLPRDHRGLPVPHVAGWTSESWGVARAEPLIQGWPVALFTHGRQGRGAPMFDVVNEPRQRRAVMLGQCQVCDVRLPRPDGPAPIGWLPASVFSHEQGGHLDDGTPVTHEPLCCLDCAAWTAEHCCVMKRHGPDVVLVTRYDRVSQMIDPSVAPPNKARKMGDDVVERERLGRVARRHGGLVGFVKLAVYEMTPV